VHEELKSILTHPVNARAETAKAAPAARPGKIWARGRHGATILLLIPRNPAPLHSDSHREFGSQMRLA
jgi:hypothetical protein